MAAIAAVAPLALAPAAHGAAVTLEPSQAAPGSAVGVRGTGFAPGARVAVSIAGRRARLLAVGRAGAFATLVTAPGGPRRNVPVVTAVAARPRTVPLLAPGRRPFGALRQLVFPPRPSSRVLNVLTVRSRGAQAVGAQVAASGGARLRVVSVHVVAGGAVQLRARNARRSGRLRAWLPGGRPVTLPDGPAALDAPATAGRARLLVSAGGATTHVGLTVAARPGSPPPQPEAMPTQTTPAQTTPTETTPVEPPPPPGPPRLVAAGDIACAPGDNVTPTACHHAQTAELAESLAPTVVATLGDNQYENGELANFQSSFGPTWGARVGPLIRPAVGNHEYAVDRTASGYFDWFGAVAGDRTKGYYAYDVGTWRLIALNTSIFGCEVVACGVGSDQEQFLRAELAAHADRCTAVYWHHPRWSSSAVHGNDSSVNALWVAAHDGGADAVLNGHTHIYERFSPLDALGVPAPATGLREFIVGVGGASFHPFGSTKTGSEVRINDAFGVLELTLRFTDYDWRFVGEDGTELDSGTQACR